MKVAIGSSSFGKADPAPIQMLNDSNIEIIPNTLNRKLNENEIVKLLKSADGLLAGLEPLNENVLEKAPKLKVISRIGIGIDNIDLKAAKNRNIKVFNTPDAPTIAVAEMTLAAALTLSRNILFSNSQLHKRNWVKTISSGIMDSALLIVGYGRIGRKTAELFRPLGAKIFVVDPNISKKDLIYGEKLVDLKEGLNLANIVTLHASGGHTILDEEQFRWMQDGVILLNAARGSLINEKALIDSLKSKKVASAWCDVFSEEPYSGELVNYDNVLLTPHISTYTNHCRKSMEIEAVNNLIDNL